MTNSIATAKCPSVLTSGNYGMSQNRYTDDSKEYIFVKLTDSAYRAVEEYQRNENARRFLHGQCAKIQFIGNSGIIHFPTPDSSNNDGGGNSASASASSSSNGGRQFGFAIDDVEGSLECIQQKQNELDVLGSLSYRMRIQANEDVYDTTRTKMAIAEETEKSKCIREIKPNQTDIGRKVKKQPLSFNQYHNHNNNYNNHNNNNNINNNNNNINNNNNNIINNNNNNINNNNNNHNHVVGNPNNLSSSSLISNSSLNRHKGASPLNSNCGSSINNSNSSGNSIGSSGIKLGATSRSPNPHPTMLGASGTINSRYGNNSSINSSSSLVQRNTSALSSAASLSSTLADGIANGYASVSAGQPDSSISASLSSSSSMATSRKFKLGGGNNSNSNFRSTNNDSSTYGGGGGGSKSLFGSSSGSSSTKNSNSSNGGGSGGKMPDICRRNIRERLIHLLALKPFKKPELYARLQNEGLRERERSVISNILKDISTMSRDNTYNLRRQMWNDVNENWPFYTEQELQLLKRRKPQNLTPPVSSDAGSSTSGQSPTSTHTGSPPPLVVSNLMGHDGHGGGVVGVGIGIGVGIGGGVNVGNSNSSQKRNVESDRYDDSLLSSVQPKKQRISHYKKDSITARSNFNSSTNSSTSGSSGSHLLAKGISSCSPSQQNNVNTGNTEENFGDSDLSYNILDNADDFMSSLEQNNAFLGIQSGGSRRSSGGASANLGNNHSSPRSEKLRKPYATGSSPSSSALYSGGGFISDIKSISGSSGGNRNNNNNNNGNGNGNGNFQRQSPNYTQQNNQQNNKGSYGNRSSKNNTHLGKVNSPRSSSNTNTALNTCPNDEIGSNHGPLNTGPNRFHNKSSRTPTPPMRQQQQQQQQQQPTTNDVASSNFDHYQQQQQKQQQQQQPQQLQQSQQSQQHPSPTQQIAAVASTYATPSSSTSGNKPMYDFSNYTPITTIEQRRQYRTEFQSDYDEYLKLLTQIESVGKRFRGLAERLENVRQGCPEFNDIRQQIVYEYERIRNAESLRRDKQRFDYLHEKLAYIKQLVTDYDKTLTSGGGGGSGSGNGNGTSCGNSNNGSSINPLLSNSTITTRSPDQVSDSVENLPEQHAHNYQEQQQQQHDNYQQQEQHQQRHLNHMQKQHIAPTTSPLHFDNHDELMRDSNQHYMHTNNAKNHNNGSSSISISSSSNPNNNNAGTLATHHGGHAGHSRYESNSDDSSDSNDDDDDDNDENDNDSDDKHRHQANEHDLYSNNSHDDNHDRY